MSEPYWTPLGGLPVDWEGAWAAGTQYAPGDVVTYQGVTYVAVNPSLGSTPPVAFPAGIPLVTALPGSAGDGQEIIFTDSLTAPTYAWHLKYVAAKATNKWVFIGGSPLYAEVTTSEATASGTYVALTTAGPSVTLPVAGDYMIENGFESGAAGDHRMSYDIGGTGAVDADYSHQNVPGGGSVSMSVMRARRKNGLGAVALVSKYKAGTYANRWLRATPIAVGG